MRELKKLAFGVVYAVFAVVVFYGLMVWTGHREAEVISNMGKTQQPAMQRGK